MWHSRNWNFSIKTTFDQYVHYFDKESIFSFDFVRHKFLNLSCHCQTIKNSSFMHIKRILKIAKNCCLNREFEDVFEVIIINVQRIIIYKDVKINVKLLIMYYELISVKNIFIYFLEIFIRARMTNIQF